MKVVLGYIARLQKTSTKPHPPPKGRAKMRIKSWLGVAVIALACACSGCSDNNGSVEAEVPITATAEEYKSCIIEGKIALINGWNGQGQPTLTVNAPPMERLKETILLALWNTGFGISRRDSIVHGYENLNVEKTVATHCKVLKSK